MTPTLTKAWTRIKNWLAPRNRRSELVIADMGSTSFDNREFARVIRDMERRLLNEMREGSIRTTPADETSEIRQETTK